MPGADIQKLSEIAIELADARTGSTGLPAVKLQWLRSNFETLAADALGGGFQALTLSDGRGTFAGAWNGASAQDRAAALLGAIRTLQDEITAGAPVPRMTLPDYSSQICRV